MIKKAIKFGVIKDEGLVTIEIEYTKDGVLSICGDIGGNHIGQIQDYLKKKYESGELRIYQKFSKRDFAFLMYVWDNYHLNNLRAGTVKQTELMKYLELQSKCSFDYETTCKILEEFGIYDDEGYKYGSAWLKIEVPEHIIAWLEKFIERVG
jgi:hypothetical protein